MPNLHNADDDGDEDDDDDKDYETNLKEPSSLRVHKLPDSTLPRWLIIFKHYANGTALYQAHDAARSHQTFKQVSSNNTHVLVTGRDEPILPPYYETVSETLLDGGVSGASHRTYMKFFASLECNLKHAFSYVILNPGYVRSSTSPFNLEAFLKLYSGYRELTMEDRRVINENFPILVDIAQATGTVTREQVETVMHDWCHGVDVRTASREARYMLAIAELENAPVTAQTNIANQGSVILTNPAFKEQQKEKVKKRLQQQLAKMQLAREKEEERERALEEETVHAEALLGLATLDCLNGTFHEGLWKKAKNELLVAAYNRFVHVKPAKKPTTKLQLVAALETDLAARAWHEAELDSDYDEDAVA